MSKKLTMSSFTAAFSHRKIGFSKPSQALIPSTTPKTRILSGADNWVSCVFRFTCWSQRKAVKCSQFSLHALCPVNLFYFTKRKSQEVNTDDSCLSRELKFLWEHSLAIALIHDSRHVGFQIVMQISHVLYIRINANCGKSARQNIELTLLKVHFII